MLPINADWIKKELGILYGSRVVKEINAINKLYEIYDGPGQDWEIAAGLEYEPNKTITNLVKTLIKEEARFMASRAPEITFVPEESKDDDKCKALNVFLRDILSASKWQSKLIKATRDCFIGKRVAMKLTGGRGSPLKVSFRPSQEFVFETADDDVDTLSKIIFFYQIMGFEDDGQKDKQRIWVQKYEMVNGRCLLSQGLFDGFGKDVGDNNFTGRDIGLDFIPCCVIINDGLTGDLFGESDVETLIGNQTTYNRTNSDDVDALRFNLFPMTYTVDASPESTDAMTIAPGAYADIASGSSGPGANQAKLGILESQFSYNDRIENRLNRTKNDMYGALSIPNVSLEQLKGLAQSGKGMKALYWPLISRCEEKWAEGWDDALTWMVESLVKMAKAYNVTQLPEINYSISVEHQYPLPEDKESEQITDMSEVQHKVRSRKKYIEKHQPKTDADGELRQIAAEQNLFDNDFYGMQPPSRTPRDPPDEPEEA